MRTIVLINGAPRSGKDSAGNLMKRDLPGTWIVTKFSEELKERCHAAYGIRNRLGTPAPHDYFEDVKDKPHPRFYGLTPRQAYIHFSETWMKVVHGKDIFGRMMIERLNRMEADAEGNLTGFLITDSGFLDESKVLLEEYGPEKLILLRLHRAGYDFKGDSRGLIDLTPFGVKTVDVNSPDGDLPGLLAAIKKTLPYLFH